MHFISLWPPGMSGWVWHFTLVYMVGRTVTWQPRVRKDGHQITMHGILRTKFFRCQRWLGILFRSWCTYATTLCFLNRSKVSYRTTGSYTTLFFQTVTLISIFQAPAILFPPYWYGETKWFQPIWTEESVFTIYRKTRQRWDKSCVHTLCPSTLFFGHPHRMVLCLPSGCSGDILLLQCTLVPFRVVEYQCQKSLKTVRNWKYYPMQQIEKKQVYFLRTQG